MDLSCPSASTKWLQQEKIIFMILFLNRVLSITIVPSRHFWETSIIIIIFNCPPFPDAGKCKEEVMQLIQSKISKLIIKTSSSQCYAGIAHIVTMYSSS